MRPFPHDLMLFVAAVALAVAAAVATRTDEPPPRALVRPSPVPSLTNGLDGGAAGPPPGSPRAASPSPSTGGSAPMEAPAGSVDATAGPPESPPPPPLGRPAGGERWMRIPVSGVRAEDLPDTFAETRGGRQHAALDIPAPRGRPVIAAEAGNVQRIWESREGGHTLYVLGQGGRFRYYYAHLEGYRVGLAEGQRVGAGEVIGYVGDSGNAVPGNTHLHFAVLRVDDPADWAGGTAVDPLPYLLRRIPLPG